MTTLAYKVFLKMKVVIVRTVTEVVVSEITLPFEPGKSLRPQVVFYGPNLKQTVSSHGLGKEMGDDTLLRLVRSAVRVFVDEQSHVNVPFLSTLAVRGGAVGHWVFYFESKANLFKAHLDLFGSAGEGVGSRWCEHLDHPGQRQGFKGGVSRSSQRPRPLCASPPPPRTR